MIAARNDDELRTTDIDVVLYIRTATGWDAEAYDPLVSKEDALIDMATEFGLPDPMSGDWMIDDLDPSAVSGNAGVRQPFKSGFFTEDPLSDVASSMDNPQPLVEVSESLGLPSGGSVANTGNAAAPIDPQPGPGDCGCDNPCLQDSIVAGIDASLFDPTLTPEQVEAISYTQMQTAFGCCIYWVWTNWTGSWSPWTCSGGWINTGAWDHQAASTICYYERTVERTQQRTRMKRCWDCRVLGVHQTRTQTGIQTDQEVVVRGTICPPAPSSSISCSAGPSSIQSTTGWSPPLPPCP